MGSLSLWGTRDLKFVSMPSHNNIIVCVTCADSVIDWSPISILWRIETGSGHKGYVVPAARRRSTVTLQGSRLAHEWTPQYVRAYFCHPNIPGDIARGRPSSRARSKLNLLENNMASGRDRAASIWRNSRATKRVVRSSGVVIACNQEKTYMLNVHKTSLMDQNFKNWRTCLAS